MDLVDIRRTVLIVADISTIKKMLFVDKLSFNIINDINFWVDKFTYHNLFINEERLNKNNTLRNWIYQYEKVTQIENNTYLILITNIIENDIHQGNKHIKISPDSTYSGELVLGDLYPGNGHPYDILIKYVDNQYKIKFTDGIEKDDELICDYTTIKKYLRKALYYDIRVSDSDNTDYLYDGGGDYESNTKIVSNTIEYLNELKYLPKLEISKATIIYLVANMYGRNIKFDIPYLENKNIASENLGNTLSTIFPLDFNNMIMQYIHKINTNFIFCNMKVKINENDVFCYIKVHLDDKTNYKIKIKHTYDFDLIIILINNAVKSNIGIVDNKRCPLYCSYKGDSKRIYDTTRYNRTIIRKAIELLNR